MKTSSLAHSLLNLSALLLLSSRGLALVSSDDATSFDHWSQHDLERWLEDHHLPTAVNLNRGQLLEIVYEHYLQTTQQHFSLNQRNPQRIDLSQHETKRAVQGVFFTSADEKIEAGPAPMDACNNNCRNGNVCKVCPGRTGCYPAENTTCCGGTGICYGNFPECVYCGSNWGCWKAGTFCCQNQALCDAGQQCGLINGQWRCV